ncbi:MAG: 4Fe-4S binding protein [Desulfuromonadales bacterium]|nr:4Fe-4S binding protein [Desulfuromonadales bacterium]
MNCSRKEFFSLGLFSLGESLLKVGGTARDALGTPPAAAQPEGRLAPDEQVVARVDNRQCPAKNCGCFSCVERCQTGAISVVMGTGVVIDEMLCSGCGSCEYVCPVTPKALRMEPK